MEILIKIKEKKVEIILQDRGKEVDKLEISEEHALSRELLPKIDEIIKRNKLVPEEVVKVAVKSDQGDSFTTTRIAKTVAQMWNFRLK